MTRPRSRTIDLFAYLLVKFLDALVRSLPIPVALATVRALAWVAYKLDRRHREVAIDNLRHAFPGQYTEAQLRDLTLDVYRHFAQMLLEMAHLPRLSRNTNWWRRLAKHLESLALPEHYADRPVLFVTAHYGNWEMGAFHVRAAGYRAHLVARPLDNPYLDADVRAFRESCGHTVLSKQSDLWKMYDVLRSGGYVCTLADQDAGSGGLFVDFFGRPASTHRVIAVLAQQTDALICVIGTRNTGKIFEYEPLLLDLIDPKDYPGNRDAILPITQRMTAAIEDLVRRDPRQYMWLHRRWKTRPQDVPLRRSA